METLKEIGGYLELELRKGEHYHKDAIRLNSGRNCFEYVLRARGYKRVYMPYYTCQVMYDTATRCGVEILYYHINDQLEPVELPVLKAHDAFLYTNYYGLKQGYVERLADKYGKSLIVDNAQAFYAKPLAGIDTFYSPRKFFGVPDGGYLYTDAVLDEDYPQAESIQRMNHLLTRIEANAEAGYNLFKSAQQTLQSRPIETMSKLTDALLRSIDYDTIAKQRVVNYKLLEEHLGKGNAIHLNIQQGEVPMVYPYLTEDTTLKQRLIANKLFVATYWPNVTNNNSFEGVLKEQLIPLPIDQRYGKEDMKRIIYIIKK